MSPRSRLIHAAVAIAAVCGAAALAQDLPYGVGSWPEEGHGNHRAVVKVAAPGDAIWAHIPWRRRDLQPEQKAVLVFDAAGQRITNVVTPVITREAGDVIFQAAIPGEYSVYYLPYNPGQSNFDDAGTYFKPEPTAAPAWLARHGLAGGRWRELPQAQPVRIEARTELDRMDPMEVIATADETKALLQANPTAPYLLFPEDRKCAVRMTRDLPLQWIRTGPGTSFEGTAQPGEYYPLQIGVWACRQPISNLKLELSGLRNEAGETIPAANMTCFNLTGSDWLGRPMAKTFAVPVGEVRPLWIGVQVPPEAAGIYTGVATVRPVGLPASTVSLTLRIADAPLADGGANDLWRLSRLKWLNSKLGLDDGVVAPYTPLQVQGNTIRLLQRQVRFGPLGLPDSILSNNRQILAGPLELVLQGPGGGVRFKPQTTQITKQAPGTLERTTTAVGPDGTLRVMSRTEADGCLMITARLTAARAVRLTDVRLELPVRRDCAPYLMGLGKRGGVRPPEWHWKWDDVRANNMVWLGDVDAGVQLQLRGERDTWLPVAWTAADVPQSWSNGGKGGCDVIEDAQRVLVRAYTGERTLRRGEELQLRFRLLITPFKPIDPNHWNWRYGDVRADGTVLHVHHATPQNPYINYPFLKVQELKDLIGSVQSMRTRRSDYGRLEYPAAGNVNPQRGALHLWTTVNFDPAAGGPQQAEFNQALFSLDWPNEDSIGFYWNIDDRGMRAYVRQGAPTKNQYPVLFGTNSAEWRRGERHVLTLSWGDELAVYVDGKLKNRAAYRGLWGAPLDQARLKLEGSGFVVDAIKISNQPYAPGAPLIPALDDATLLLDTFSGWNGAELTRPERSAGQQGGTLTGAYTTSAGEQGRQIALAYRETPTPPKGVNLYYTVRELSNRVAEMWVLRSLGDEIFPTNAGTEMKVGDVTFGQTGGGYPWLREHLVDGYRVGWRQPLPWLQETDAAIETQGLSRWHNYYVEGLDWLMRNTGLDGVYLDGIGYDREIMKRLAKVLYRRNPAARINYHSGDNWSPPWDPDRRVSPANATMEHFPYISNLWFGELYDYNMPPDYWLVEMSGLPFGLTGEMLNYENGGNPYRGMIYGMTGRQHPSATSMWRFWDEFGIQDAEWLGYWSPRCPVKTNSPEVLATVYRKPGQSLIALAHWPGESPRRRTAQAPACATPPAIDGRLTPGEWDGAAVLTGFTAHDADTPAEHGTVAHVTWTPERLFVGFRCDSPLPPKAAVTKRDGEVWLDDAMELFVQPEPGAGPYFQFVGNSRDTIFDCRGLGKPEWNGNWAYRTSVGEGYWEGELSIAWADLGMRSPAAGHTLGLNLCRDQQVPIKALSCWSQVSGAFHDTSQFGRLTLAAAGSPATAPPVAAAGPIAVRLAIDWRALGLDPRRVRITAPPIAWFQEAREFALDEPIPVEPSKGWLLRLEQH